MSPTPKSTAFLAALLVSSSALLAQPAEPRAGQKTDNTENADVVSDKVYFERIEVSVVNVEVYVTNKKGEPVMGLDPSDFEILEDGEPQEVTHFYAIERGRPRRDLVLAAETGDGAAAPETATDAAIVAPPPEDQVLRLVVFFDNLHTRPQNRNKVIRNVTGFLRRILNEGDEAMLVTFDRGIHVRHAFTRDLDSFGDALTEIETLNSFYPQKLTERSDALKRLEKATDALDGENQIDFYAKSTYYDVEQTINGLREIISSMAGLAGRKALLYVSDGLQMTAGEELFHFLGRKFPNSFSGNLLATRYRARRQFRELTSRANANGVTLYTLEAAGLRTRSSLSAEHAGSYDTTYVELDAIHDLSLEEPLMMMAEDTGGLAALNTNNIDGALDRVAEDFENFYSLGYMPVHARPGEYHKIEVKVKEGRGLNVRHRTGYRDKMPSTKVYEGTLATLLYGAEQNPLEVRLVFGQPRTSAKGKPIMPVEVKIPIGKLALLPRETIHQGRVQVAVGVIDADGGLSAVEQQEIPVNIPDADLETARQQVFTYAAELLMKPGSHRIAVGVRDDFSGETSFIRREIRMGD